MQLFRISIILPKPSDALPPACSTIKAIGLHSVQQPQFPFGDFELVGYI
jgi:hypothetical protein